MYGNFSDRMATVLEYVNEEALRLGDEKIGVEHLMLGIIREGEGTAVRTLNVLGLEMGDLKRIIEEIVSVNKSKTLKFNSNEKGLTKQTKNILDKCLIELQSTDEKKIEGQLLFENFYEQSYLIPELRKAQYLLKIEGGGFDVNNLLKKLNEIDSVISSYRTEISSIKSKYNLIFE